jgi:hypothetical protein
VGVVREVRKADITHELERLDEILGFTHGAADLLDERVAHERLAAQVAGVKVPTVAMADGGSELEKVDLFDGDVHDAIACCTARTQSRARHLLRIGDGGGAWHDDRQPSS